MISGGESQPFSETPHDLSPAGRLALWVLGIDALAGVALAIFSALHQLDWLAAAQSLAGALLQGVWMVLLAGLLRGEAADSWSPWLTAYQTLYPLFLIWQTLLFVRTGLNVLVTAGGAGVVAWLVLLFAWGGSLLSAFLVYRLSLTLILDPQRSDFRPVLRRWLEWGAIFGLIMTIINVVPPADSRVLDLITRIVWGAVGLMDVAALLMLRRAIHNPT